MRLLLPAALLAAALALLASAALAANPRSPRVLGPRSTADTTPTYRLVARTPGTRFLCAVDRGRLRACGSPWTPRLGAGAHVLRVVAVDRAGRRSGAASLAVRIVEAARLRAGVPVPVDRQPFGVALAGDSLWVASFGSGAVQRLDSATGAPRARVEIGAPATSIVAAPGSHVWAASFGRAQVVRVDGDAAGAQLAVGPGPEGMASGFGALWTANKGCLDPSNPCPGNGSVTRVDPVTGATAHIPVGHEPRYVAAGAASVWVTSYGSDTLTRIDPLTGAAGVPVPAPAGPNGVVEAFGSVWVAGWKNGQVWRYDPGTLAVTARIPLPLGAGPEGIGAGDREIWVANDLAGSVSRIDAASSRVTATVRVGSGPRQVAAGPGFAWVSNLNSGTLQRVERR